MKRQMKWPCQLKGYTHAMSGKRRTVNARIEGLGDVKGAALRFMLSRRNAWEWYGEQVTAITPLGQRIHIIIEPKENMGYRHV